MTLIGPDGAEATTFGEMLSQIRSVAFRLTQERVAFGDRVALIGENHPHWAIAYLGILYRGAIAVPLDQSANTEALAHFIEDSGAKLAFVSPSSLDKFRAVCERLGRRIPAVVLRDGALANGLARFEDWARTPRPPDFDAAPPPARPEDIAVLMYTSGTTGTPKAVPLTHGNIFAESDGVQKALRVSDQEVVLSLLPLFHAYSQVVNLWVATIIGARVVYITELSSAEIERGLKEGGATALAIFASHRDEIGVVITDMMMPVMDGPVTIRALQKLNPQVRIIASSGATESIDAADLDQLGVKTFLTKPYDAKTLLKIVAQALRQDTFAL
jgi:long-chain acyl-CoA synthetase